MYIMSYVLIFTKLGGKTFFHFHHTSTKITSDKNFIKIQKRTIFAQKLDKHALFSNSHNSYDND